MKLKHKQGTRDRVITIEMKLSWFELRDIVLRLGNINSNNSVWAQFVSDMQNALEYSDEPH
jgi:hypothetical protein